MDDRRASILLGVLYGDSLGAPYEFSAPPADQPLRIGPSVFGHAAGRGTDDTETTVAVARGLLDAAAAGDLRQPHRAIAERLLQWYESDPPDVGNTTRAGLATYRDTRDPLTSGPDGPSSVSNGSLMRSAPFVLAYRDIAEAATVAAASSAVSHRHPTVLACVRSYVELVAALLDGRGVEPSGLDDDVAAAFATATGHSGDEPRRIPCAGIGHAPYALTLAYWSARSPLADSFERGIELVVRAGGDTDTNGAICGAVLVARHGFPPELLDHLDPARVEELRTLATNLLHLGS